MKKIVFIAALFLTACQDDFLEKEPLEVVTPENFYQNANDALRAVNAAYRSLMSQGIGQFGIDRLGNYLANDAVPGDNPDWVQMQNFTTTTDNGAVRTSWAAFYQGIFRANLVLERVPPITMDQTLKNRILAEASFL